MEEKRDSKGDKRRRPTGLDIIVKELPFKQRRQGHDNPRIMQR